MMKLIKSLCFIFVGVLVTACVNQHPKISNSPTKSHRLIATSVAISEICDRLHLDLVGVTDTKAYRLPKRYENVKRVGLPMNPDMEVISSLKPDLVLSPSSLKDDLEPKYKTIKVNYGF